MKPSPLCFVVLSFLSVHLRCRASDLSATTLRLFHVNSPCSPLRTSSSSRISWEESILQMQSKDKARLQYLSNLGVIKKSPIASGKQIIQTPNYIVKVQIGMPSQTMLMAIDTSSDAAWVPCQGCIGCSSNVVFNSAKSTTFKTVSCQAAQCKQVVTKNYDLQYIYPLSIYICSHENTKFNIN